MKLKKLYIQNWKSFKTTMVELNDGLNVLVGPNASGKTNLLDVFKFLNNIPGLSPTEWTYRQIVYGHDYNKVIQVRLEFAKETIAVIYHGRKTTITPAMYKNMFDDFRRKIVFITHTAIENSRRGGSVGFSFNNTPDRITRAMETLFPDLELKTSQTTGCLTISAKDKLYGAEIIQPRLPSGLYKLFYILAAIENKPSIICIDEIENSLDQDTLEYLMLELRNSGVQCLISTHSPAVVDIAGLESLLLTARTPDGSKVRRIENLDFVKQKMNRLGLTPGEAWIYGL